MVIEQAPIHMNIKRAIVEATEDDTELVLRRWRNTSRLFRNKPAIEAVKIERESTTGRFEEVQPLVSGQRGRQVFVNGDKDFGVWTAGQVIGLIHDIPTCAELVARIEKDAIDTLRAKLDLSTGAGSATALPVAAISAASGAAASAAEMPSQEPSGSQMSKRTVEGDLDDAKTDRVDKEQGENQPQAQLWGIGEKKGSGRRESKL